MANDKELKFIKLVASGKTYEEAYRASINQEKASQASKKSCQEMGSRWAKKLKTEIEAGRLARKDAIESAARTEIAQEALAELLTQAQVDKRMCEIIKTGTPFQALRAMDMYNMRFGSYSPVKQNIKTETEMPAIINWDPEKNGTEVK